MIGGTIAADAFTVGCGHRLIRRLRCCRVTIPAAAARGLPFGRTAGAIAWVSRGQRRRQRLLALVRCFRTSTGHWSASAHWSYEGTDRGRTCEDDAKHSTTRSRIPHDGMLQAVMRWRQIDFTITEGNMRNEARFGPLLHADPAGSRRGHPHGSGSLRECHRGRSRTP